MSGWRAGAAALWLWGVGACTPELPVEEVDALPLRGVELVVGHEVIRLEAAAAWVDEGGTGRGEVVAGEVSGTPPLTVSGSRSSWQLRDQVVVFEGEVVAERGDLRLTAERLEVRYSDDRVQDAVATGAVRLVQGDREARADRARLTLSDGAVVLEGDPQVLEGPNRLSGERIVLFLDDERLECESCRLEVDGEAVRVGEVP